MPSFEQRSPCCSRNLLATIKTTPLLPARSTQAPPFRSLNKSYRQRKQPATRGFGTDLIENGTGPSKGDDAKLKLASDIFLLFIISSKQQNQNQPNRRQNKNNGQERK